jgi:hypothetical protein
MTPTFVNLTPHDWHLYDPAVPDRIDPDDHQPILTIPASGQQARAAELLVDRWAIDGVPVRNLVFGGTTGLPPYAGDMADAERQVWYLVSTPVAIAEPRADLLVAHDAVRAHTGKIIGCRMLGRPVPLKERR